MLAAIADANLPLAEDCARRYGYDKAVGSWQEIVDGGYFENFGARVDEIADRLQLAATTVKTHLGSLMNKLGARNRVEIAMWAHETGRIRT